MGPGDERLLTVEAREMLATAAVVFAAPRIGAALVSQATLQQQNFMQQTVPHKTLPLQTVRQMESLQDAMPQIAEALPSGDVVVCVSGDPGLYSLLGLLRRRFPETEVTVLSGIGSLQYLCDRLGESREQAVILSAHGRELEEGRLVGTVAGNAMTLLLLDTRRHPAWLCETLTTYGLGDVRVAVGESLSYPEEVIAEGTARELTERSFGSLCVARVRNDQPNPSPVGFGLRDEAFLRGEVPMTKSEVRAVLLSRLELGEEAIVWDVGAGTGSVAVECARLCRFGIVHAVERDPEALSLIEKNREKFNLHNLVIHAGAAPDALAKLPCPTHVFVGGSGGELSEILRHIGRREGAIRVVVAAVTLETAAMAVSLLGTAPFREMELCQIGISRGCRAGSAHLMTAQNPVTLVSAWTGGENT